MYIHEWIWVGGDIGNNTGRPVFFNHFIKNYCIIL
nr:MAG TPA: hypothetical protein [Caudoviricetes sp.]